MPIKYVAVEAEKREDVVRVGVHLEEHSDGVSLLVGDFYVCTLRNDGTMMMHQFPRGEGIVLDDITNCVVTKFDGVHT